MYWNYRENFLGPQAVSFVESFIVPCPYLGEFTFRGSSLYITHIHLLYYAYKCIV